MSVEPRVEDLLASIRRAIDDEDAGAAPAVAAAPNAPTGSVSSTTSMNEQGKLTRGSIREMRVSVDGGAAIRTSQGTHAEIDEIRAKVDRNNLERASAAKKAAGHFTNIMSGQNERREPLDRGERYEQQRPSYPPLRDTIIQSAADYDQEPAPPPPRYYRAEPAYEPQPAWNNRSGALMSQHSAQSAQASFDHLAETIMNRIGGDRSLEDITRELLRGMLRHWLDENLPTMVENLVREEIERVARRGR